MRSLVPKRLPMDGFEELKSVQFVGIDVSMSYRRHIISKLPAIQRRGVNFGGGLYATLYLGAGKLFKSGGEDSQSGRSLHPHQVEALDNQHIVSCATGEASYYAVTGVDPELAYNCGEVRRQVDLLASLGMRCVYP